jgi:hypothetical protein
VSSRTTAIALAIVAIGLTIAQDVWPARDWYHSWQYIALLALTIVVMAGYAWGARTGSDGVAGKRFALALAGAIVTAVAGLLSGLIGPDTVTVVGTPGTVTPIPDLGVAAFFGAADAASIARGDATVLLRKRGEGPLEIGTQPTPLGLSVVFTQLRPAAYVVARDAHGNRLTVTQPNNPSFLSPVMLFRQQQQIRDKTFPMDTFATPAEHRITRILYFSAADLAAFRHGLPSSVANQPGAVLSVADDAGNARGLTIAGSGIPTSIANLDLTITLGSYPVLLVASAPQPAVMLGGILVFVLASVWALFVRRGPLPAVNASSPSLTQT